MHRCFYFELPFSLGKGQPRILAHSHVPFVPRHFRLLHIRFTPFSLLFFFILLFFFFLSIIFLISLLRFTSVQLKRNTNAFKSEGNQFPCLNSTTPIIKLPQVDSCKKEKSVRILFLFSLFSMVYYRFFSSFYYRQT